MLICWLPGSFMPHSRRYRPLQVDQSICGNFNENVHLQCIQGCAPPICVALPPDPHLSGLLSPNEPELSVLSALSDSKKSSLLQLMLNCLLILTLFSLITYSQDFLRVYESELLHSGLQLRCKKTSVCRQRSREHILAAREITLLN